MTRQPGAPRGAPRPTRTVWRRRWSDATYAPPWPIETPGLVAEIADGWLGRGGRLLDIGCGDGRLSLRLAALGFDVLGVDYAEAAIRRAEARAAGVAGVRFALCDICRESVGERGFDALVDNGCFQSVHPRQTAGYARHVAAAARPAARFLLLLPIFRPGVDSHDPRERCDIVRERLVRALAPSFEIERISTSGAAAAEGRATHRLVARLVRRTG